MVSIKNPSRRVVAIDRAEATTGLVQVPVDGVLGQAKLARDFLGAHVTVNESETFALTLGEAAQAFDLIGERVIALVHRQEPYANVAVRQASEY